MKVLNGQDVALLMYFVGFLDLFAVSMIIPLVAAHARELGATPSVAGILGSLYGGLQLFSSPLVGHLSDISGRKPVLVLTLILSAVGYAMFGLATSVLFLFLARIPGGLFKHTQALSRALLVDATRLDQHSQVLGRFNALSSAGFIVGPMIGGHLGDTSQGRTMLFVTVAVMFFFNAVVVWIFAPSQEELEKKLDPPSSNVTKRPARSLNPLSFMKDFKSIEWDHLWDIFLVRFLLGFAVIVYRTNFSLLLEYKYEASPVLTGYLISYSAVVGTVSGFMVGWIANRYESESRLLLHTSIATTLSIAALMYAPTLYGVVVFLTPLGISNAITRVCVTNLTLERGRGQETGALLGLGASVLSIARMLAPALGGIMQEVHMSGPAMLGAVCAVASVVLLLIVPQDNRTPALGESPVTRNPSASTAISANDAKLSNLGGKVQEERTETASLDTSRRSVKSE